jgi:hypothetical protein
MLATCVYWNILDDERGVRLSGERPPAHHSCPHLAWARLRRCAPQKPNGLEMVINCGV